VNQHEEIRGRSELMFQQLHEVECRSTLSIVIEHRRPAIPAVRGSLRSGSRDDARNAQALCSALLCKSDGFFCSECDAPKVLSQRCRACDGKGAVCMNSEAAAPRLS